MAKRKVTSRNFPFESNFLIGSKIKFTKICDDMMKSDAWQDLSIRSRGLYLELKRRFVAKSRDNEIITNQDELYIYTKDFHKKYSYNTLMKDVDDLIDHGFIRVVQHGRLARLPNIYGFSDKWKKYGTKEFFIHPNEKRLTDKKSYSDNDE